MAEPNIADLETSLSGRDPRASDWGLCRTAYERDSCGFGLIASLDDQPSHWVLQTAISSLNRLTHRGAIAADGKTGDGCGLLIKQPTAFLRAVATESGIKTAPLFAAGLVFLNPDPGLAAQARRILTEQLALEKLWVAGFRTFRVDGLVGLAVQAETFADETGRRLADYLAAAPAHDAVLGAATDSLRAGEPLWPTATVAPRPLA